MNKLVIRKTTMFLQEKDRRRHLMKIVLCLSLIVAFVTSYLLIRPAITMEKIAVCGVEEHTHTQECYQAKLICGQEERQAVPGKEETVLTCEKMKHEHTQECQDENGQIICGYDAHIHGTECYLTTYTQAVEGHAHTDACYTKELVCQKVEHTHTDVCYPPEPEDTGASAGQPEGSDTGASAGQPENSNTGANAGQPESSNTGANAGSRKTQVQEQMQASRKALIQEQMQASRKALIQEQVQASRKALIQEQMQVGRKVLTNQRLQRRFPQRRRISLRQRRSLGVKLSPRRKQTRT